jgi:hypothetical protein
MRDPIHAKIESFAPGELRLELVPALTQSAHVHRHPTNPTRLAMVIVCQELHELRPLYELLRARFEEQEDTPSAGGSPDSRQGPEAAASAGDVTGSPVRHPQYTDEEEARAEAEHETQICREELEAEDQRREAGRALGAGREQLTDEQVRHYAGGAR